MASEFTLLLANSKPIQTLLSLDSKPLGVRGPINCSLEERTKQHKCGCLRPPCEKGRSPRKGSSELGRHPPAGYSDKVHVEHKYLLHDDTAPQLSLEMSTPNTELKRSHHEPLNIFLVFKDFLHKRFRGLPWGSLVETHCSPRHILLVSHLGAYHSK